MSLFQLILLVGFIACIMQISKRRHATAGNNDERLHSMRHERWRGHARGFSRRARAFAGDLKEDFSEQFSDLTAREKSLKKQVKTLEERVQVLERIVTGRGFQTAQDIDNL